MLCFVSSVFAQVQTRLRLIEASNKGSTVDPSLKDLAGQLGSLFSFTSYRLLRDNTLSLSPNQPIDVPTAHQGRVALEVTLVNQQKNLAEYRIRIRRERTELLNTQVRLSPGRTVLIGGPKHGEGIIILALSANL
jgi:hypothetical protein